MDRREIWFAILLILLGVAGFIYSVSLPTKGPIALSPGLFPGFVTALLVILGGVWLASILSAEKPKESDEQETEQRSFWVTTGLFVLYLVMLEQLHFLASTLIFLFVSMLYLYRRFRWKIPIISVITTAGVYYLFRYLLNVRLP
ncbi:MAG: tripartite tricarboxylate transporter TctB family protein [Spirochaetaceae bacterium]